VRIRSCSLLCILLITVNVVAKELPNIGPVFPIIEEDLEEAIQNKLKSPEGQAKVEQFKKIWQEQTIKKVKRPIPVAGVVKATSSKKFKFDPSTSIPHDLKDHKGVVFYKANTKVNPLDKMRLPAPLVFIDGDDEDQVDWVVNLEKKNKINAEFILVKGSPFDLMKQLKRPVYFDQGGFMVRHFTIKQVPAMVAQENNYLTVEEVPI
jgi:conjugal transfer pilus assembly protein TraW